MSAPSEYYRKVIEVLLLRQIINQRRGIYAPLVFGLDVEAASLTLLNEEYEVLMEIATSGDFAVERPARSLRDSWLSRVYLEGDES